MTSLSGTCSDDGIFDLFLHKLRFIAMYRREYTNYLNEYLESTRADD